MCNDGAGCSLPLLPENQDASPFKSRLSSGPAGNAAFAQLGATTDFKDWCNAGQVYHLLASGQQSDGFVRPAGSFDGVYFVGQSWVSVWVFDIGDGDNGVVLVDALNNPGRRQGRGASGPGRVRVQGLRHQGRLISITHEHADHDGGLRYLQDTVGMPAYATKDAWEGALGRRSRRSQGAGAAVPERDPDGRAGAHVWQRHLFRLCTRLDTRRER
ncbi:hypothetical protein ACKVWC_001523 [Pyricularia oryzae]